MYALALTVFAAVAAENVAPVQSTATAVLSDKSACTCYYTYDEECPKGFVCDQDWDPIGCVRMKPKGGAYKGKCTEKDEQKKVRPCDATCSEKTTAVSVCAGENTADVARAFDLWRQAMTEPALSGGGPMDAELVAAARALPLSSACVEYVGWRTLAVLELCRGHQITDHTDAEHDELTEHRMTDLSGDSCRVRSGDACIAAVIAGLSSGPDAVDAELQAIPQACGEALPLEPAGPGYEGTAPLAAVSDRLKVTVTYLQPAIAREPESQSQRKEGQ